MMTPPVMPLTPPPATPQGPAQVREGRAAAAADSSAVPVEVLVYNVSHTDLLLTVVADEHEDDAKSETLSSSSSPFMNGCRIARPKFSQFHPISRGLLQAFEAQGTDVRSVHVPEVNDGLSGRADDEAPWQQLPMGMELKSGTIPWPRWSDLHLRSSTAPASGSGSGSGSDSIGASPAKLSTPSPHQVAGRSPEIQGAYFPLLAQVLPRWCALADSDSAVNDKHVFLISGAGRPRNKEHSSLGNSTSATARLMRLFIEQQYPGVHVTLLDSKSGVFHYDENVTFVRSLLLPKLVDLRYRLAVKHGDLWKSLLRITIALTDGTPARLAAINASLRMYRPSYLHMWQLKTFWHEQRMIASDLQLQTFENIETKPAVPVATLDDSIQLLVEEMIKHKRRFEEACNSKHELGAFWLRKTRKPVLSVLMVQRDTDAHPTFFRGMNVEVSMPTGSLCSERNVIGTALASDQSLCRLDFKMIAVLSMTLEKKSAAGGPVGAPMAAPGRLISSSSVSSLSSSPSQGASCDDHRALGHNYGNNETDALSGVSTASRPTTAPAATVRPGSSSRKRAYSSGLQAAPDLNPISPCGACEEWLKKIAEVNPTFKVVTFPNTDCSSVFVSEVF